MPSSFLRGVALLLLCLAAWCSSAPGASGQILTVNVGDMPVVASNLLVAHGDNWHWRRGTNAPQADWRTATDAQLDGSWSIAPGGFGYGDNAIVGEATRINPGMSNVHTTVFIRRTFTTGTLDTNAALVLTVDYDDGFVAYLDGVEVTRRNVPGTPGTTVLSSATTGGVSHEASCCNNPNPAISTNLGPIGAWLAPGEHVFAVVGVNADLPSSDFHLIPDLAVVGVSGATNGAFLNLGTFVLATTNIIDLTGSNTVAGSTRVTVNGDVAALAGGQWNISRALRPGLNRFYVAAHDGNGNILTNLSQDVVYQPAAEFIGGTISTNVAWTNPAVVIHVTNVLTVAGGAHLDVAPGVVVLLSAGASIVVTNDSSANLIGTDELPAVLLPGDGVPWGSVMAAGTNAVLTVRHAEIVSGQVRSLNGGAVLMEDSVARELPYGSRELVAGVNGGGLTLRRSRLERFTEIDARETPVLVEDCLLEGFFIDGLDIKGTNVPLVVRSTTLRYASPTNSNADALDFGPGPGTVERCLIHDFPDKGVSIGGASGTRIRDTLIYRCGIGISAYSSTDLMLVNNTVAESVYGILFRDNPAPAIGVATNLIVWANTNNVVFSNSSTLTIQFSDIEGTNFPGSRNISSDPAFVNVGGDDYRLAPGSPALGTGAGGVNMGASFPLGGIPARPLRLVAASTETNGMLLKWSNDAENVAGFLVQRSSDGVAWQTVGSAAAAATSCSDPTAQVDQPYYYRVRATNHAGVSAFSNPARGFIPGPVSFVGGVLAESTTWSGTVIVTNSVMVPAPFTLTISAGATVRITNNASITATGGGHIEVNGTADRPVTLDRSDTTFTRWGDLAASGAGSSVTVRHARLTHGRVRVTSGGTALVEDCELSQMSSTGIIGGSGGALFTVRRTYVHDYEDIDLVNTRTVAEDSLFERANSDIFELQSSPAGSVLRRCTFRNCLNPNSDGVDMNGCVGVVIDSCRVYNVTDKGISSGSASSASDPTSFGLVVSNTLIHSAAIGIAVKDSGTASLFHNAISDVADAIAVYGKFTPQGGHVTNGANNILWNVTNAVRATENGTVAMDFSDLQGVTWPGTGNISSDPLFLNAAARDYRIGTLSPARGTGLNGTDMGARFPVGAPMAPSHSRIDAVSLANGQLVIQFWADSEKSYVAEQSPAVTGAAWTAITNVAARATPVLVVATNSVAAPDAFLRLSTP